MIIDISNLSTVMVEVTSNCNSMCLQCARNDKGETVNPLLPVGPKGILAEKIFKKFFNDKVLQGIKTIQFNGNFGDPILYPNFFNLLDYLISSTVNREEKIQIQIHTNGGIRNISWWSKLGTYLKNNFRKDSYVEFGIDGIDNESHEIYRKNVVYDRVIENAKAFINAGGNAHWQYLSFQHNHHLVEKAKEISKELGFKKIFIKTKRLNVEILKLYEKNVDKKVVPVFENMAKEGLSNLEKLVDTKYNGDINQYYSNGAVECEWYKKQKMYLSFDGLVYMCCHHSGAYVEFGDSKKWNEWVDKFGCRYDKNWNNLNYYTLEEIISHPFFKNDLEESFNNNFTSKTNKRLKECTRRCGEHTIIRNTIDL